MYIYKKNRRGRSKNKSRLKGILIIFKTIPTVFFTLFLILTVTILTGMCAIFPKKKVVVYDNDEQVGVVHILNENIDECLNNFLTENGLDVVKTNDLYELNQITDGEFEVKIKRGFKLNVLVFGENKSVEVNSNFTVGDVLNILNVKQDENVTITPDIDSFVNVDTKIEVIKTERKIVNVQRKEVPHTVKQVFDDSLSEGKTIVKQDGVNEIKEVYEENLYNDGKLVKVENKEKTIKPGQEKIILVGRNKDDKGKDGKNKDVKKKDSKHLDKKSNDVGELKNLKNKSNSKQAKPKDVEAANKNLNKMHNNKNENADLIKGSKKILSGVSTAYLAKGNTARMGPARPGVIAADPRVLPYGTRVYIPGYGSAVVGDKCGAACRGSVLVDVCFKTLAQCKAWGRKSVKVYVL